ncbi:MAG: DUF4255 domain-containing protein [Candidatus Promineifilaceae bacterium]
MMSNYRAIAAVTIALRHLLAGAVTDTENFTISRPDDRNRDQQNETGINIFLYQAALNPSWRNADAPTRNPAGQLIRRPLVGLDLYYLFSFYGPDLVPQLLLGQAVNTLHARPILSVNQIREAVREERAISGLAGSASLREEDFDQVERVRFTPVEYDLESLSKLWSVLVQVPYTLSIAYQASVVLIEADLALHEVKSVLERDIRVSPAVDQASSEGGENGREEAT